MDAYITAKLSAPSDNVEIKAQKMYLKDKEKTLTSVQARVGMILDPLTKLSSIFDAASMEKAKELNCEEVMETIKKTVIMTSQAVNYITHQRRWNAISAYKKTERGIDDLLRKYSKDFAKEEKYLFGDDFQKNLSASHRDTKKIEAALKKPSSRPKQENRNPKSKKPFRKDPGYQTGSWGNRDNPYSWDKPKFTLSHSNRGGSHNNRGGYHHKTRYRKSGKHV